MGTIKTLEDKLNETSNGLNKVREDISAFEVKIADASVQKHKVYFDI
jgi:septal ring factor EnvC (AmiA/AmiB activator)